MCLFCLEPSSFPFFSYKGNDQEIQDIIAFIQNVRFNAKSDKQKLFYYTLQRHWHSLTLYFLRTYALNLNNPDIAGYFLLQGIVHTRRSESDSASYDPLFLIDSTSFLLLLRSPYIRVPHPEYFHGPILAPEYHRKSIAAEMRAKITFILCVRREYREIYEKSYYDISQFIPF